MIMRKLNLLFLICNYLFLSSCRNQVASNSFIRETETFNKYLESAFDTEIPADNHVYFIFQSQRCEGCANRLWQTISNYSQPATVIFADKSTDTIPDGIIQLYDKHKKIDRINLGVVGTILIFTEDGKINQIISINPDNVMLIDDFLNQW